MWVTSRVDVAARPDELGFHFFARYKPVAVEATVPTNSVNTRHVHGRRKLRFSSLDEMMADVMRIAEADRAGTLKTLGNWTAGQCFGHIAGWMTYAFDGYPMRPPRFMKVIGRMIKNKVLRDGMGAGMKIPKAGSTGTYCSDPMSLDEGLQRLSQASNRLQMTDPRAVNPVFGPLTHQQWIDLNLRHAELHLSFFDLAEPSRV
jgi:hypothetical protein